MLSSSSSDPRAGHFETMEIDDPSTVALTLADSGKMITSSKIGSEQLVQIPSISGALGPETGAIFWFNVVEGSPIRLIANASYPFKSSNQMTLPGGWGLETTGDMDEVLLTGGIWTVMMQRSSWCVGRVNGGSALWDFDNAFGNIDRMAYLQQQATTASGTIDFVWSQNGSSGFPIGESDKDCYFVDFMVHGQLIADAASDPLVGAKSWKAEVMFWQNVVIGGTLSEVHSRGLDAAMLAVPSFYIDSNNLQIQITVGTPVTARYIARMIGVHNQGNYLGT